MKCSLVSVLLYLFLTIFMVEKADTQQYVEVCTLLLCSCSTVTITLHVAWYDDCRWFLDIISELCGVMLFEVCMLCFIVTRATVSLQIKHIGFVLLTGSTNAYLSVHSFLNSQFLESTFRFLSGLEHAMIFVC